MIKFEHMEVVGFEAALRGMRNPMNSWEKSDSIFAENGVYHDICGNTGLLSIDDGTYAVVGPNDLDLAMRLAKNGPVHAKYRRMIVVYVDITAPLYWWKEFDTYKVGTVANSCSTMHKIHAKEFTLDDFSHDHLYGGAFAHYNEDDLYEESSITGEETLWTPYDILSLMVHLLNFYRKRFLQTNDKKYWWQMIQLLPSSYNQRRTVMLNFEVLSNIYRNRREHKLDEWQDFCKWIEELPYSEFITLK